MDDPAPWVMALLVAAAFVAGLVDAVAGGGGLIGLPALLAAGLPPAMALGTNKAQSVWGSGAALLHYSRAKLVRWKHARLAFPLGFLGAVWGVYLLWKVMEENNEALKPIVLGLLAAVAVFLAFRPKFGQGHTPGVVRERPLAIAIVAVVIGAYDGFFGPGTGTFLILAHVILLGQSATEASAEAKVVNFASNLAACLLFAWSGHIVWKIALPMAAAQLAGATIGARITVRTGDVLVRRVVMVVVIATCSKLAYDMWG